jgi:hypothetical protein
MPPKKATARIVKKPRPTSVEPTRLARRGGRLLKRRVSPGAGIVAASSQRRAVSHVSPHAFPPSASSDKNRRAAAAMPHHTDDVTACEENAVTSSSRATRGHTVSITRSVSGRLDHGLDDVAARQDRVVPPVQARRLVQSSERRAAT